MLWLCAKRPLCFSQLAIINGEERRGERKRKSETDQKRGRKEEERNTEQGKKKVKERQVEC